MRKLVGPLIGFGIIVAAVLMAWLVLFGTASPCEAMAARMADAVKDQPADVQKAATDATRDMSPLACAAGAFRLAAGDRTVVTVVKE